MHLWEFELPPPPPQDGSTCIQGILASFMYSERNWRRVGHLYVNGGNTVLEPSSKNEQIKKSFVFDQEGGRLFLLLDFIVGHLVPYSQQLHE